MRTESVMTEQALSDVWTPAGELRQSLFLIGFMAVSVSICVGIGMLLVTVLAGS
ncbi:MAG TPA: hypothetical protein VGB83_11880 [Actinomycetota bacterium]